MLTDFGASKYTLSTERNFTEAGDLSGTISFNSPERLNDDQYKEKEDIWAMGVSIYLLSSFELPFDAKKQE